MDDPSFVAVSLLAVALTGLSKGGFSGVGMLSTPLLTLYLPPSRAAAIMLPIIVLQDVISVASFRANIDWTVIARLAPGGIAGIAAGYVLAARLPQPAIALSLGAISLAFALRGLSRPAAADAAPRPAGRLAGAVAGFGSGLTSMLAHAGSPPYQMYVLPLRLDRDLFVGTTVVFFAMMNGAKLVPYIALGQLDLSALRTGLVLFPWAICCTYAGIWLVRRTDPKAFEKIILVLLAGVGIMLLHEGWTAYL